MNLLKIWPEIVKYDGNGAYEGQDFNCAQWFHNWSTNVFRSPIEFEALPLLDLVKAESVLKEIEAVYYRAGYSMNFPNFLREKINSLKGEDHEMGHSGLPNGPGGDVAK